LPENIGKIIKDFKNRSDINNGNYDYSENGATTNTDDRLYRETSESTEKRDTKSSFTNNKELGNSSFNLLEDIYNLKIKEIQ